jgi:hypothetical protein
MILDCIELPEDFTQEQIAELANKITGEGLWYRIHLNCTLDTDTGKITVDGVKCAH